MSGARPSLGQCCAGSAQFPPSTADTAGSKAGRAPPGLRFAARNLLLRTLLDQLWTVTVIGGFCGTLALDLVYIWITNLTPWLGRKFQAHRAMHEVYNPLVPFKLANLEKAGFISTTAGT